MALDSAIEWTDATWNPCTGCTKVSPGCRYCYAERMARRLCAMGSANYRNGFELTMHDHMLGLPLKWRRPRVVFVNSMSDLFHKSVATDFILSVFDTMRQATWHRFQVLTKRSTRLLSMDSIIEWPRNVWAGVSVENEDYLHRIEQLRQTRAAVKFLSIEPLLGPIPDLDLTHIDWVIVGGESGPSARPMHADWVIDIRDQCLREGVPFLFKQWGGTNKKAAGRRLDGRTWDEFPADPLLAV